MGAWEAPRRLQNREESQRGRLHRRQLSGRQDEREGKFLQSVEQSTLSCRWWSSSRTTHGWRGSSRTGSFMASVAISTPRAVWPLWGCTGTGSPSAPAGRSVDRIWGQFSFVWLTLWQKWTLVRSLEEFMQVIYCGVQKGMIDSSRLCNKGLTNRETVLVDTFWACLCFSSTEWHCWWHKLLECEVCNSELWDNLGVRLSSVCVLLCKISR